ncbi:HNH endonuclease [Pontibacter burrus]|uniref:Restriction endonuclease n=1 Tax=Pontibacter burrus TaxID=2704466 RepID=A0A6B3LWK1_9BACT|nr:HNH endonuclease [Pontibacter burrus]NEM97857.1 restriction endonuclease [Pontibacter burrus]
MADISTTLKLYLKKFIKLRQGVTKYGKAPHKPVLLLTLIDRFEKGEFSENRIYITPELVGLFKETFSLLARTAHKSEFSLPFYHLSGEGFWAVKTKSGATLNLHIKSINTLDEVVDYAYFTDDLYLLLINKESRNILKTALLDHYFSDTKTEYLKVKQGCYIQNLQSYLLNESTVEYRIDPTETDEEEQYIRSGLFKKLVPQVYNHTCSISGMRLVSSHGFSMIDACHIVPFSLSKDDKITNGLALCPNLHRAFDRGLITVDVNLKVLVSDTIAEDISNNYALQHLKGRPLSLPFGAKHYPAVANLAWHRDQIFKG